jgi:hypothetical protein
MGRTRSLFLMVFLVGSCAMESEAPLELERAIDAFVRMTSPAMLRNSMFYAVFPNGTPKEYVSFLFSDLGAAEWPPAEGVEEGLPGQCLPPNVAVTHTGPDTSRAVQVVIRWDDERRMILFEGYADPREPPVVRRETDLPVVRPSDAARLAAQGILEMGGRAQAF